MTRKTRYSFAISDSIGCLEPASWDALTAGKSFFLSRPYLSALEQSAPDNLTARCALVYDGRRPVAAVSMQLVDIGMDRIVQSPVAPARLRARALVCGNLFSWGQHGVAFSDGVDPAAVWPAVAEVLYRVRKADTLSGKVDFVAIKDLPASDAGPAALKRFRYRPVETEPNMVLTLEPSWKSFDDYLGELHSHYRKNARGVVGRLEKAGCSVEPLGAWGRNAERLYDLYLEVHRAAGLRPVTATPDYLPRVAAVAGADMRCTVVRRGEEILGFVTTLKEDSKTAIGYYIGFSRDLRGELPVYFALLQSVVKDAIALGCTRVSFGRTALEPKAKSGALPEPTSIWVRHSNPLANWAVGPLLGAVRHREAPKRNVFKAGA